MTTISQKNNNLFIFGLTGHMGVGKSTLAKYLALYIKKNITHINPIPKYQIYILPFAQTLKNICAEMFAIPLEYFNDQTRKNTELIIHIQEKEKEQKEEKEEKEQKEKLNIVQTITPRKIMQHLGTDLLRKSLPDIWTEIFTRLLKAKVRKHPEELNFILVDDVRFPNEAKCLKNLTPFCKILKIRDKQDKQDKLSTEHVHSSEKAMTQYPCDMEIILNKNGNKNNTRIHAEHMIRTLWPTIMTFLKNNQTDCR